MANQVIRLPLIRSNLVYSQFIFSLPSRITNSGECSDVAHPRPQVYLLHISNWIISPFLTWFRTYYLVTFSELGLWRKAGLWHCAGLQKMCFKGGHILRGMKAEGLSLCFFHLYSYMRYSLARIYINLRHIKKQSFIRYMLWLSVLIRLIMSLVRCVISVARQVDSV